MPPTPSEGPKDRQTRGALLLSRFLKKNGFSHDAFAKIAGLDRVQITRALGGKRWARISVDFAIAVRDATKGLIPIEAWRSETARAVRN